MKATKIFLLGGKSTFTIKNPQGDHYTFRITTPKPKHFPSFPLMSDEQRKEIERKQNKKKVFFVGLLSGPDTDSSYTYLGVLDYEKGQFLLTSKSRMRSDAKPVKVFSWTLDHIWNEKEFPEGYSCDVAGRCGRCGRALTHPDGVSDEGYRLGFGPECWKQIVKEVFYIPFLP